MRIPFLISTITLITIATFGTSEVSSTRQFLAAERPLSAAKPTTFSSSYTSLTKCGSGMTKKEEKEAENQGSDIPTRCKGPAGYDVYIYYSACASHFTIDMGDESTSVAMQTVNWKQKTVEWRLANGKPFAVIVRVYKYDGDDLCTTSGKVTGESLLVKGLKGYEHIDESVEVKGNANANVKAREVADKGFEKSRS